MNRVFTLIALAILTASLAVKPASAEEGGFCRSTGKAIGSRVCRNYLPTVPEDKVEKADIQVDEATPSSHSSVSPNKDESRNRDSQDLGICQSYISSNSEPDSFEYREGMYRCQYGL